MKKGHTFLEQVAMETEFVADALPFLPIVEITGECRVLIENHFGIKAFSCEKIVVEVKNGSICVHGQKLELMRVTKEQLVITGKIDGVSLHRRG